jgi:hypothetical protein
VLTKCKRFAGFLINQEKANDLRFNRNEAGALQSKMVLN